MYISKCQYVLTIYIYDYQKKQAACPELFNYTQIMVWLVDLLMQIIKYNSNPISLSGTFN